MRLNSIKSVFLLFSMLILAACGSTSVSDDSSSSNNPNSAENPSASKEANSVVVKGFDPVVHFDFDKSVIKSSEAGKIVGQADKIKKDKPKSVIVEGHTDIIGTKEYNIALGERRANSTKKALVKSGVNKNDIEVVSYGKERLLDTSSSVEANAKNRRTVTVLK